MLVIILSSCCTKPFMIIFSFVSCNFLKSILSDLIQPPRSLCHYLHEIVYSFTFNPVCVSGSTVSLVDSI